MTLQLLCPPGKEPLVPIEVETGWAPELVWHVWRKNFLRPVFELWSAQSGT